MDANPTKSDPPPEEVEIGPTVPTSRKVWGRPHVGQVASNTWMWAWPPAIYPLIRRKLGPWGRTWLLDWVGSVGVGCKKESVL